MQLLDKLSNAVLIPWTNVEIRPEICKHWRRVIPWLPECLVVFEYDYRFNYEILTEIDEFITGRVHPIKWTPTLCHMFGIKQPDFRLKSGALAFDRVSDATMFMLSI